MSDLVLASAHHLIVFGLAAVLAAELALMRPAAMSPGTVRLLGRFDAAFGAVGLLSIRPTKHIAAWQILLKADAAFVPQQDDVNSVRRFMLAEIHVLALVPVFAVAKARGVGY